MTSQIVTVITRKQWKDDNIAILKRFDVVTKQIFLLVTKQSTI